MFRTLGVPVAARDSYRNIKVYAGRNSVVFRLEDGPAPRWLKCYLKAPQFPREVYNYISTQHSPLLTGAQWLEDEIYLFDNYNSGSWHGVAVGEWVEGETLENLLRRAAHSGNASLISALADSFDALAREILHSEWAHGDLKPENIIVGPAPGHKMTLVDYDAFFIPALAGRRTAEPGTKPFQHPARDASMYDKHIDDYSIALISVSLHMLARNPRLYAVHNRGDNLILDPWEILSGCSQLYGQILDMLDREGNGRLYSLARMLVSPTPVLEGLCDIFGECAPKSLPVELTLMERDGKWGYADDCSDILISPQYSKAYEFSCGLAAVQLDRYWHFIDHTGQMAVNCAGWDCVKPFHEGLAAVEKDGLWGYIDISGEVAIEPRFTVACNFCEGAAAVKEAGKYGYIDPCGVWIVEPKFDSAGNFRDGKASVRQDGKDFTIGLKRENIESPGD